MVGLSEIPTYSTHYTHDTPMLFPEIPFPMIFPKNNLKFRRYSHSLSYIPMIFPISDALRRRPSCTRCRLAAARSGSERFKSASACRSPPGLNISESRWSPSNPIGAVLFHWPTPMNLRPKGRETKASGGIRHGDSYKGIITDIDVSIYIYIHDI